MGDGALTQDPFAGLQDNKPWEVQALCEWCALNNMCQICFHWTFKLFFL